MREAFTMLRAKIPDESDTKASSGSSVSGASASGANVWAYPSSLILAALVCVVGTCCALFILPAPGLEWLNFRAGPWTQALVLCLAFLVLWALFALIFAIARKIVCRNRTSIALADPDIVSKPLKWYGVGASGCMIFLVGVDLLRTHHYNIVLFALGSICAFIWLWLHWPAQWRQRWLDKRKKRLIGTSFASLTGYFPSQKAEQEQQSGTFIHYDVKRSENAARR
jgi:hypothetical protein